MLIQRRAAGYLGATKQLLVGQLQSEHEYEALTWAQRYMTAA
jgi:hypothetical protein